MKIWLARLLVLFLIVMALWVSVKDQSLFHVKEILISVKVKDLDRPVWEEMNREIANVLASYKGLPLWKIRLAEINKRLAPYSFIFDVTFSKSWPSTLEVAYSFPALKAIYRDDQGKFKILTERGQWVGPTKWSRLPVLPWVRGAWVEKDPLKTQLLSLIDHLPAKGSFTKELISEIQFSDLDGFLLTLIKSGQQIRFGNENFEIKSLRVAQVLEYLQTRGLESRVIDANFSKKVLVRLRNHP